jgi:hypothetical protein
MFGIPTGITVITQMVNDFMTHAVVRKGLTLLELRMVAANFKTIADNWNPPGRQEE